MPPARPRFNEPRRAPLGPIGWIALAGLALPACRHEARAVEKQARGASDPAGQLDVALDPTSVVDGLSALAGAHLRGTARFVVQAEGGGSPPPRDVTTQTELWMDAAGQYRLVESNDHDGGREIVRTGGDLAVALRPGKLVKRAAQDPEPRRLLEQALGAPWAVWELVRAGAAVATGEARTGSAPRPGQVFRLTRAANQSSPQAQDTRLRQWRRDVGVDELEGELVLMPPAAGDARPAALLAFRAKGTFHASKDGHKVRGSFLVTAEVDQIGQVPAIEPPQAEALRPLQRTSTEEKALLSDGPEDR